MKKKDDNEGRERRIPRIEAKDIPTFIILWLFENVGGVAVALIALMLVIREIILRFLDLLKVAPEKQKEELFNLILQFFRKGLGFNWITIVLIFLAILVFIWLYRDLKKEINYYKKELELKDEEIDRLSKIKKQYQEEQLKRKLPSTKGGEV